MNQDPRKIRIRKRLKERVIEHKWEEIQRELFPNFPLFESSKLECKEKIKSLIVELEKVLASLS